MLIDCVDDVSLLDGDGEGIVDGDGDGNVYGVGEGDGIGYGDGGLLLPLQLLIFQLLLELQCWFP